MSLTPADENALDSALRVAAADPAARPDFYRLLMESTVYIISGDGPGPTSGARTLAEGEQIQILNWAKNDGTSIIPFFTSLPALQRALTTGARYMALQARALFEMTRGATLVLNPKSDYGKEFLPNEIEALLTGGVNRLPETQVTEQQTKVLLGQPAQYPTRMVESLTSFFARRTQVKAAYLILMQDPARDTKPHLVVGIDAAGDIDPLLREAASVAGDTAPEGVPVDLLHVVRGDQGLGDYCLNTKPFYERTDLRSAQ
jgi:hypothetical protein